MDKIKLNKKQQEFVTNNHNLIYSFMRQKNLSLNSVEDWYGTCAIGLCKAGFYYKKNCETKFSTYAYFIMNNEVRQILRKENKNVKSFINLDDFINDTEGLNFSDILQDKNSLQYIKNIEFQEILSKVIKTLSEDYLQILNMRVDKYLTHKEIAKQLGISQATVSRKLNKFREILFKELYPKQCNKR